MAPERDRLDVTEDAVLGGRLRLRQPRRGHRVGHDAILLAAATPALADEHALELGAGVGAAGLALAKRVERLRVTLLEIDPLLCELARDNAARNDLASRVVVVEGDVAALGADMAARFQRVLMNPPFNDATRQQASPDPARRLAHAAAGNTLAAWIEAAAYALADGGTLTMIWRADELADVETVLGKSFGAVWIVPVLPREGVDAIRVLVRAEKGGRAVRQLLPGLILNTSGGSPTAAAEMVLREGKTLPLADF
jgi:tRNA1(Val) A37 N6-methylase TrmN6